MEKSRPRVAVALAVLVLVAGALFGGRVWGLRSGRAEGYGIGLRHGLVRAAQEGPPQVRDLLVPLATLGGTPAWTALGAMSDQERAGLADLANRAPSPCPRQARRGHSLASTLVDSRLACTGSGEQLRLALAALRTFGAEGGEALAVLRVERRALPVTARRALLGAQDADVVVVVWGDFQCPHSARATRLVSALLEERADVAVAFKHLPLPFHPAALPAALAAEAAAEQGAFWPMHDALFELGRGLSDRVGKADLDDDDGPVPFEDLATALGLDVRRFRGDFRGTRVRERVAADIDEARALGVASTPTFFVDSRRVEERPSAELLGLLIDKARAERQWRFSWDLRPPPPGADDDSAEAGP